MLTGSALVTSIVELTVHPPFAASTTQARYVPEVVMIGACLPEKEEISV